MRPRGAITEAGLAELVVAALPSVEALSTDPVVPAGRRDVPAHLLGMAQHRHAVPDLALLFSVVHGSLSLVSDPNNV